MEPLLSATKVGKVVVVAVIAVMVTSVVGKGVGGGGSRGGRQRGKRGGSTYIGGCRHEKHCSSSASSYSMFAWCPAPAPAPVASSYSSLYCFFHRMLFIFVSYFLTYAMYV
ncbi:hypothetical protein U1Q18_041927 [Sarracenia purpurea var. burkii]